MAGKGRVPIYNIWDLDHRACKNKPNKIRKIVPFYLLPTFPNLQMLFVLHGSPKWPKSVFFFPPYPIITSHAESKLNFLSPFISVAPCSSSLQTQHARLAKPTSLSPALPSQILFEARLWHRAYNNRKHLIALSSLFIPSSFFPLSVH